MGTCPLVFVSAAEMALRQYEYIAVPWTNLSDGAVFTIRHCLMPASGFVLRRNSIGRCKPGRNSLRKRRC